MESPGCSSSLADVSLCSVCCEQIRTPKIIPCGHSFCLEPCLRTLLETSQACPLCRKDIQTPPSGLADDFPTNFALLALVSTGVNSAFRGSQSLSSEVCDGSNTSCEQHQSQGKYFCGTCLKFLCDECNSTHEDGHEIEELNTISERRIGELEPLMGEIANSLKIIRERMEYVENAKIKCAESCQQAESEIRNAVSSCADLMQEEGKKLVVEVTKGKDTVLKALNQQKVQLGDAEGAAERTEQLAASLKTRLERNDIRDTGMFNALMTQQKKMNEELASIRGPPDVSVLVKFQSNAWLSNPLGCVNVVTEAGYQPNQPNGPSFGNTSNVFGLNTSTAPITEGSLFGTPVTSSGFAGFGGQRSSFSFGNMSNLFGTNTSTAFNNGGRLFGNPTTSSGFASFGANKSSSSFGNTSNVFGSNIGAATITGGSRFGAPATGSVFAGYGRNKSSSSFGNTSNVFSTNTSTASITGGRLFATPTTGTGFAGFGVSGATGFGETSSSSGGFFGQTDTQTHQQPDGIFGQAKPAFGQTAQSPSLFGNTGGTSLFGHSTQQEPGSMFGQTTTTQSTPLSGETTFTFEASSTSFDHNYFGPTGSRPGL